MGNKVLVVDDDPGICDLVKIALSSKGFVVKTAGTGEEAIKCVAEFVPDLILLDRQLPDMDGKEVARKIKESEISKNADIIMMTGENMTEKDLDVNYFAGVLNKPFRLADLAGNLSKYLKPD